MKNLGKTAVVSGFKLNCLTSDLHVSNFSRVVMRHGTAAKQNPQSQSLSQV